MVAQRQAGCIPIACPTDCPQKLYAEAEAGVAAAAEAEAEAGAEAEADAIAIVMEWSSSAVFHGSRTAGPAWSTARAFKDRPRPGQQRRAPSAPHSPTVRPARLCRGERPLVMGPHRASPTPSRDGDAWQDGVQVPASATACDSHGRFNGNGTPSSFMISDSPVSAFELEPSAEDSESQLAALQEAKMFASAARDTVDDLFRLQRLHELKRRRRAIQHELEGKQKKLQLLKNQNLQQQIPQHVARDAGRAAESVEEKFGSEGIERQQYLPPLLALNDSSSSTSSLAASSPKCEVTSKRKSEENQGRDDGQSFAGTGRDGKNGC